MQRLCFKPRNDSRTVQIVRHVYCPQRKRSRTIAVGSFPASADPEDFLPDLRMNAGMALTEHELAAIARWLIENGDPDSARRRQEAAERVAARLRAESTPNGDAFEVAKKALETATAEFSEIAADLRDRGEDVWKALRQRYLDLNDTWKGLRQSVDEAGVLKKKRAGKTSGSAENDQ